MGGIALFLSREFALFGTKLPIKSCTKRSKSMVIHPFLKDMVLTRDGRASEQELDEDDSNHAPESYLLARTLSESPKLGSLVRRLVLGTHRHGYQTTELHIKIVTHCTALEDLKIWGYNGWLLADYQAAVRNLRNLRTLNISRYCLAGFETDSFMGFEEILPMLRTMPRMEQLRIPTMGYCEDSDLVALEKYCESQGIDCHWSS